MTPPVVVADTVPATDPSFSPTTRMGSTIFCPGYTGSYVSSVLPDSALSSRHKICGLEEIDEGWFMLFLGTRGVLNLSKQLSMYYLHPLEHGR